MNQTCQSSDITDKSRLLMGNGPDTQRRHVVDPAVSQCWQAY